ncbi:MAG: hypothetical protein L0H64_22480, partial [Pseudonocardia sp.]|nr:hypothetical protein [Pseudonocardia sp.]
MRIEAATVTDVAAGFGVNQATVWRWGRRSAEAGVSGLTSARRGPKGPSKLTGEVITRIGQLRGQDRSLRSVADEVGVSVDTVRRALAIHADQADQELEEAGGDVPGSTVDDHHGQTADVEQARVESIDSLGDEDNAGLPVLADPAPRHTERGLARWGHLDHARPVFTPCARAPLAGLFLAMPGLATTGLLQDARTVFGPLPGGFYGLEATLLEAVLRTLAGRPRAQGAARLDPLALGRVLGLDRAPEVKTIRRKLALLAGTGKGQELVAAMASRHLASAGDGGQDLAAMLYVDGHVRAYYGRRTIAKTHLSRLRFPAPATVETWVCDAVGDPVMVVMSQPGASLAAELRRLLPALREAVGDDRRVLVGFDRGGWSPALFAHMASHGFDVLTWRKGRVDPLPASEFSQHTLVDEVGRAHTYTLADTRVELALNQDGGTVAMRQVTRREEETGGQVHILTTDTDLEAAEVVFRMGSRWRIENAFRYGRLHLDLDSHDSYSTSDDDPGRSVPNPARRATYARVVAAREAYERAVAQADQALLALRTPTPGDSVLISNAEHDAVTAGQRAAQADLVAAEQAHRDTPARLPLGQVAPGQQVLDVESKLITHAVKIAAFNTTTALVRDLRIHTGDARAADEAHTLI